MVTSPARFGQTASQVTSALNLPGCDASNLLFGMQGWTTDKDVGGKFFDPDTQLNEYPYEGTKTESAVGRLSTESAQPETVPETGDAAMPVEAILLGPGIMTAAVGLSPSCARWRSSRVAYSELVGAASGCAHFLSSDHELDYPWQV